MTSLPYLMLEHARKRANSPAFREKSLGIWQMWTWSQVSDHVRRFAAGLSALGFGEGMHIAIVGDNRPHLYWSMLAAQSLGGVAVPLYQDANAADMGFVLKDADVAFVVAEDQEQVDKILEVNRSNGGIRKIIYSDPRGLHAYQDEELISFEGVQRLGDDHPLGNASAFQAQVEKVGDEAIAIMLYTSGTTGAPKGVCLKHKAMVRAASGTVSIDGLTDKDVIFSYLPMAWVGDNLFSYAQALVAGFCVCCPESKETVMTDMREVGPTYFFAPPRIFEGILTSLNIRMEDANPLMRLMFKRSIKLAERVGSRILDGQKVSLLDRLKYMAGDVLIYAPLRNMLGFSRMRVAYTAGSAIGPDLFRFYRSIGVNMKQLYGSTETTAYIAFQPDGKIHYDCVGRPAPGVELKFGENNEVLVRSDALFSHYYKRPDATAEAYTSDGYFRTGDVGVVGPDEQIRLLGRAADLGYLADGSLFAPEFIENKLKFFPYIKEAVCFGDGRDFVTCFINIDLEAAGNWAEQRNVTYSGYADLARNPKVQGLVASCIEQVNAELSADSQMHASVIRRFVVLNKELDPDDGELTRTRKVRRQFINERYGGLIDAMYAGKTSQFIEVAVKFEDGSTGSVRGDLAIRDVGDGPLSAKAA